MKIIVNITGFTLAQQIIFVGDNEEFFTKKATLKNIPEVVSELANQNNCSNIYIYGNKKFTKNIGENIKNIFSAKFSNKEQLKIEYINK